MDNIDIDKDDSEKLAEFVQDRFSKASNARQSSGIENIWHSSKNAYDGVFAKQSDSDGEQDRSRIFVQMTRAKCVSALSSIVSTIFQKGKLPYSIDSSKIPDSINDYMEFLGYSVDENLSRMKDLIKDQVQEANIEKKVILAILDMIVYGTCFIRVPVTRNFTRIKHDIEMPEGTPEFPTLESLSGLSPEDQELAKAGIRDAIDRLGEFVTKKFTEIGPDIEVLKIWDAFPDPDMNSTDTEDGDWIIHRSLMTKIQLLKKVEDKEFDRDKIISIIEENNNGEISDRSRSNDPSHDYANSEANYTLLRYCGSISTADLMEFLHEGDAERISKDDEYVEAIITVIGNTVLDVSLALDIDGTRQYQLCPYEQVPNRVFGRGVPENMRDYQALVNGLTRSLVESKKNASSVQTIVRPDAFKAGSDLNIGQRKVFKLARHATSIKDAIQFDQFPDTSAGTLDAISLFRSMADESSGISSSLQGQLGGSSSRRTAFEVDKVVNSANMLLDNVIRNCDQFIISKIIKGFYKWNMEMSDDSNIKGDFTVLATGFQSFRDKAELAQKIDILMSTYGQDQELRKKLNLEELMRKRLEIDDMDQFMWDTETISKIQEQEVMQAQANAEAQSEQALQEKQRDFDNQVLKKAEIEATKEDIQAERDVNEALSEKEDADIIKQVMGEDESDLNNLDSILEEVRSGNS